MPDDTPDVEVLNNEDVPMRCASCLFWDHDRRMSAHLDPGAYRPWGDDLRACILTATEDNARPEDTNGYASEALAYGKMVDGSERYWRSAVLWTTPSFGCIQWQKRSR